MFQSGRRALRRLSLFLFALPTQPMKETYWQTHPFELTKEKDQFGLVFAKWGGWKYEGECEFRVGQVLPRALSTRVCCLAGSAPRFGWPRIWISNREGIGVVSAYLRGLDIGTGTYNATTEFMFDGKYIQLQKNGTFGWTKLTYVGEIKEKKQAGPSFGLMAAPGYFWIDDVSLVQVGPEIGWWINI